MVNPYFGFQSQKKVSKFSKRNEQYLTGWSKGSAISECVLEYEEVGGREIGKWGRRESVCKVAFEAERVQWTNVGDEQGELASDHSIMKELDTNSWVEASKLVCLALLISVSVD